ncbi:MAG: MFS transporter [Kiritimatiellia bacterium]
MKAGRLPCLTRLAFGAGDLAQNLIYQTISIYLLIFYTNVYGLAPAAAAGLFLAVRLVDVAWDPLVGAFVDRHSPRLGKYRSYLLYAGVPLAGLAVASFWTGPAPSFAYAVLTYGALSMIYTLVNVPYGALNASLSRETDEITSLTSIRMVMANLGGLAVGSGVPFLVARLSPDGNMNSPDSASAWLATMAIFAAAGLLLLVFCFARCRERVAMDAAASATVKVSDLWMEFARNRPLRVIALFFVTAFAMLSVGNAAGGYFLIYNLGAEAQLPLFMALGSAPAFVLMPLLPVFRKWVGKLGVFYISFALAIGGMLAMYGLAKWSTGTLRIGGVMAAQLVKSSGVLVATGYMWALVPEVISYGELRSGRRIAGIVNALTGIFYKAGMALGGVVPGIVLAATGFAADAAVQTPLAEEGILWLMCLIPAALLAVAACVIARYELDDATMERINSELEGK